MEILFMFNNSHTHYHLFMGENSEHLSALNLVGIKDGGGGMEHYDLFHSETIHLVSYRSR